MKRVMKLGGTLFLCICFAVAPLSGQIEEEIIDSAIITVFTHCHFEDSGTCGTFTSLECGWPFDGNNLCVSSITAHGCEGGESVYCDFRERWCEGRCSVTNAICYSATRTYCN